ncbi:MAG: acylneuraminate cytidylyltransferase family protein [Chloroflexi bacterium OHK40]
MTSTAAPRVIALIPARSGSKRVPGKNIRPLGGHPLLAYTIAAARRSGIFEAVIVSTDDEHTATIARYYGAEVPFLRPVEFAGDLSPDIDWVEYTLTRLRDDGRLPDCFSILRPTSPFRQPETIQRCWAQFCASPGIDSIRAIEKVKQHPAKMWLIHGDRMAPLLLHPRGTPWHSQQYQALPEVYVQNASLEIAWCRVVFESRSIAGQVLAPFITVGYEGIDVNDWMDWLVAEELLRQGKATLPTVDQVPFGEHSSRS